MCRWEALQVHVGRLHVEVCTFRWADETLPQAHRSQTVPVPRLWTQLLPLWSPGFAQETPPPGVKPSLHRAAWKQLGACFNVGLYHFDLRGGGFKELALHIGLLQGVGGGNVPQGASLDPFTSLAWIWAVVTPSISFCRFIISSFWHCHTHKGCWKVQTLFINIKRRLKHLSWPESSTLLWLQNQAAPSPAQFKPQTLHTACSNFLLQHQLPFLCMHSRKDCGLKHTNSHVLC